MKKHKKTANPLSRECPICKSPVNLCRIAHPGYLIEKTYDIYECKRCYTQHAQPLSFNQEVYDIIYSQPDTPGYKRYSRYAEEIKNAGAPIQYLANQEAPYYAINKILPKIKSGARILEVGCGRGYLTYALRRKGYHTQGIDISVKSVNYAKKNFGPFYKNKSIKEILKDKKVYDVIIATELIEHLQDPIGFVEDCMKLLAEGGMLIITTPNRNFYSKTAVWRTDLPPVHLYWFSEQSLKFIARHCGAKIHFIPSFIMDKDNSIANFIKAYWNTRPTPVFDYQRKVSKVYKSQPSLPRKFYTKLKTSPIINRLCNILFPVYHSETIAAILTNSYLNEH